MSLKIKQITGKSLAVRGNDIDTDRIIPARFLKCVVFEGLGQYAFADDRAQLAKQGKVHPFDHQTFSEAQILLVNENFGCGSSREHAPQSLMRWGIKAIIGESFSEIFFGNNVALGVVCVVVEKQVIEKLMNICCQNPNQELTLSLEELTVSYGDYSAPVNILEGARQQFLQGTWDVTAQLLSSEQKIEKTAENLPYFNHWH